jgi:hypothetical protein
MKLSSDFFQGSKFKVQGTNHEKIVFKFVVLSIVLVPYNICPSESFYDDYYLYPYHRDGDYIYHSDLS